MSWNQIWSNQVSVGNDGRHTPRVNCKDTAGRIQWQCHGICSGEGGVLTNVEMEMHASINVFTLIWGFPKIGIPQTGWFIMENPIKVDDLGVPIFLETSILIPLFMQVEGAVIVIP